MKRSSDTGPTFTSASAGPRPRSLPPGNWREALMALISARFALIELEAKETVKSGVRRATLIATAAGCAVFTWILLLAGGISLIAEISGWRWNRVALAAAACHLLAGILLARLAKSSAIPSFPITRAEFQKDREWIENYQETRKSNG